MGWSALTTNAPPPIKHVFQDRKGTPEVFSPMASLEQEAANRALVTLEGGCSGEWLGGGWRLGNRGFSNILGTFFPLSVCGFTKSSSRRMWREAEAQKPSSKELHCLSFYLYRVFDKKVIIFPFTGGNTETRRV